MKHYNSELTSPIDNEQVLENLEEIKIQSDFSLHLGNANNIAIGLK